MKSLPQRSCIGCNTKKDKRDLIRIVKSKDGNISIDKTGKAMVEEHIFVIMWNV